jgi:uncharacterized protein
MASIFLLPGWLNSGPSHWQSRWEHLHGCNRVDQHDWQRPLRGDWVARLEDEVLGIQAAPRSIILIAHSLGCHLVASWAAASRNGGAVRGALLVAPPDVTRGDLPPDLASWRKPVLTPLPFPAICVVSSNDPFDSSGAGRSLANAWGARYVEAGALGHINGDSHLGDWPQGHALLQELMKDESHHGH